MPALMEDGRAKVNLTLRVVGRRVDGYHDLESVVAFADCADSLSLTPGSGLNLATSGPMAQACGEASDNLVFKAAPLLSERVPDLKLGDFILDTVLPVAAGIGGGSADAAAALRLLAQANGLELDDPRLIEVARLTGADVPVCLNSNACVMTGVGETLLPLSLPKMPCVMVNPRIAVATKDVFKAAQLLSERVPGLKLGDFILDKVLPVAAGIGGGSADAAAALRLLAQANGLELDDPRLIEVARLTGADVPVCLASNACVMTGVGETLLPLSLPKMPCVMVNPRIAVATKDVFKALGLRNGQLLVSATDVFRGTAWPDAGASLEDWVEALAAEHNDLEAPATRIQPVIGEVLAALNATNGAWLARMSGSGATCFAIYENTADAQRAAQQIQLAHPGWWVHAGVLS